MCRRHFLTSGKPGTNSLMGGCYVIAKRNGNKGQLKHSINGVSKRFKRMAEVYRIFAADWAHVLDFSDEMLIELFNAESFGSEVSKHNGFACGKRWLNVNVSMWKEDIAKGLFRASELYADPKYPVWWLDSIFKK
jgi:hypothetical protein